MKINCYLFSGCYLHLLFVIVNLQFPCGVSRWEFLIFFLPLILSCLSPSFPFSASHLAWDSLEFFSVSVSVFNKFRRPITGVNMSLLLIYPNMRILWSPNLMEKVFPITLPWRFQPFVPLVIIKFISMSCKCFQDKRDYSILLILQSFCLQLDVGLVISYYNRCT